MLTIRNFDDPPLRGMPARLIGDHSHMNGDTEVFDTIAVTVLTICDISGPGDGGDTWAAIVRLDTGPDSGEMRTVAALDLYQVTQ